MGKTLKLVNDDPTIDQYGNKIREVINIHGYNLKEIEDELGLSRNSVSSLLHGRRFMAKSKIVKLLEYLEFKPNEIDQLMGSINQQSLYPIVKNKYLGFKLRAIRIKNNITLDEFGQVTKTLSKVSITPMEGGFSSIGTHRYSEYVNTLNKLGVTDIDSDTTKMEFLINESWYSDEDIIAAGQYLEAKYIRRNKQRKA